MRRPTLTKLDLAQFWIDVPLGLSLDDFAGAKTIVHSGFIELKRTFPAHARRWSRWKTWWMIHLAEINGEWKVLATYSRRALSDRGVQGTWRLAAYAALGRALGHFEQTTSVSRARVLRAALRVGVQHPNWHLFSVVSQLERAGLLTWSKPTRRAFRYLVTKCIEPRGTVPRNVDEMRELVRSWRSSRGIP